MVVAVNFRFFGKEGGGGINHGSRGCGRGGEGGSRDRGGEGPKGRGGEGPSIKGSAAVTGTMKIALLILLSRLCMLVGVYPVILS